MQIINNPKRVILHCSATPDYLPEDVGFDAYGASEIDAWHKERGWDGIGYHFVIRRTGVIEHGRSFSKIGAHVKGHNTNSLGICYIGTQNPMPSQITSLINLFHLIRQRWDIYASGWYGHYEFDSGKICPGLNMTVFRRMLQEADNAHSKTSV